MHVFLIVLFPRLTVDLQMAFYNHCHNKLTFKGHIFYQWKFFIQKHPVL